MINECHGPDDKRIIPRPSSAVGAIAHNNALAEFCAPWLSHRMASAAEDRRKALKDYIKSQDGLKVKPWCKEAGVSDGTVRNFLAGKSRSLRHETLQKLAKARDATVADLIGEKLTPAKPGRDVIAIPGLEVRAAMGGGVEVSDEVAGQPFYFRKAFAERVSRGRPGNLRVIELTGDSMEPTLSDGDVALVNLGATDVASAPGVYCLWNGRGLVVKRLAFIPGQAGKLRIKSDNPLDDTDEVDAEDVRIIGRVMWRGGLI